MFVYEVMRFSENKLGVYRKDVNILWMFILFQSWIFSEFLLYIYYTLCIIFEEILYIGEMVINVRMKLNKDMIWLGFY